MFWASSAWFLLCRHQWINHELNLHHLITSNTEQKLKILYKVYFSAAWNLWLNTYCLVNLIKYEFFYVTKGSSRVNTLIKPFWGISYLGRPWKFPKLVGLYWINISQLRPLVGFTLSEWGAPHPSGSMNTWGAAGRFRFTVFTETDCKTWFCSSEWAEMKKNDLHHFLHEQQTWIQQKKKIYLFMV